VNTRTESPEVGILKACQESRFGNTRGGKGKAPDIGGLASIIALGRRGNQKKKSEGTTVNRFRGIVSIEVEVILISQGRDHSKKGLV